jgi:RecB family exonuclease
MQTFLGKVATEVLQHYKADIRNVVVVLPTRRACLYFKKHLSEQVASPVWSPEIVAINDFILSLTGATVPDDLELIAELYFVFQKYFPGESFDNFFPWGKMLLKDFDEIDRWMIDAKKILSTLSGMKSIDAQFELPEEVQQEIRQFAEQFFAGEQSAIKSEFSELWDKLFLIYADLKGNLVEKNLAYEGMAYHNAALKLSDEVFNKTLTGKHFVFAGFYALSASEERIIHSLRNAGMADLFWDSDEFYFNNPVHEAGHFLRDNSLIGGSNFNWNGNHFKGDEKKNIVITGVPLQTGQAKEAGLIVKNILKNNNPQTEEHTAIILPDERMLLTVLHSLPEEAKRLNVTMGYPLSQSPLFTLVEALFNLYKHSKSEDEKSNFYHRYVKEILLHPYIISLDRADCENLLKQIETEEYVYVPLSILVEKNSPAYRKTIFSCDGTSQSVFSTLGSLLELLLPLTENEQSFSSLDAECLAEFYSRLTRLKEIVFTKIPKLESRTLWNLILEIMNTVKIPFSGEPLSGLQVMGFLETRGLDFENIILLNMNEGTLPSASRNSSFIPFVIRKSFGLPVFTEQDAISSYHFYRLLQRAKNIYLLYDTEVKKLATGERSRFILQLLHEFGDKATISEELLTTPVKLHEFKPVSIEKNSDVLKMLNRFLKPDGNKNASTSFSHSKLTSYINCPLQFYFRHVAGLKQTEDMTDEIDERTFGTLLHECMKSLYGGRKILDKKIFAQLKDEVPATVTGVFADVIPHKATALRGKNLFLKKAVEELVYKILEADSVQAPIEILLLEKNIYAPFTIGENQNVTLYGVVDRADKTNGTTRIVDYKTGRVNYLGYKNVEELFSSIKRKELFQLLFYSLLFSYERNGELPSAGIYVLRDMSAGVKYLNDNPMALLHEQVGEFRERLTLLISEILNPEIPFRQTEDADRCTYCEFKDICMR